MGQFVVVVVVVVVSRKNCDQFFVQENRIDLNWWVRVMSDVNDVDYYELNSHFFFVLHVKLNINNIELIILFY